MPRVRLRTPSGQWLVIHGATLTSSLGENQVAITIEPGQTSDEASVRGRRELVAEVFYRHPASRA